MGIGAQLAAAEAKLAYWASLTGGVARRWVAYWSSKVQALKNLALPTVPAPASQTNSGGGSGGVTLAPPTADVLSGAVWDGTKLTLSGTSGSPGSSGASITNHRVQINTTGVDADFADAPGTPPAAFPAVIGGVSPGTTVYLRSKPLQSDNQYATAWSNRVSVTISAVNGPDVTAPPAPTLNAATSITDTSFAITASIPTDPTHGTDVVTGTQVGRLRIAGVEKSVAYVPRTVVARRLVTVSNGSGTAPPNIVDTGSALTFGGFNCYGTVDKFTAYSTQLQGNHTARLVLTAFSGSDKIVIHWRSGTDPSAPFLSFGFFFSGGQLYITCEYRLTQGGSAAQFSATPITLTTSVTVESYLDQSTNTITCKYKIGSGSFVTVDNAGVTLAKQVVLGRYVECMLLGICEQAEPGTATGTGSYSEFSITPDTVFTFAASGLQAGSVAQCTCTAEDGANPPNVSPSSNQVNVTTTGGGGGGGGQTASKNNPAFPRTAALCANSFQKADGTNASYGESDAMDNFAKFSQATYLFQPGGSNSVGQAALAGIHSRNPNHVSGAYQIPEEINCPNNGANPIQPSSSFNDYIVSKVRSSNWYLKWGNDGEHNPSLVVLRQGTNRWCSNIGRYTTPDANGDRLMKWFARSVWGNLFDNMPDLDMAWQDGGAIEAGFGGDWKCDGTFIDISKVTNTPPIGSMTDLININYQDGLIDLYQAMASLYPTKYMQANMAAWGKSVYDSVTRLDGLLHGGLPEYLFSEQSFDGQGGGVLGNGWDAMLAYYRKCKSRLKSPYHIWFHCLGFALNDYRNMRYGLGSCLMDDGFFAWCPDFSKTGGGTQLSSNWNGNAIVMDEYVGGNASGSNRGIGWLGFPISSPPTAPYQNNVWRRDFQNGIALVLPGGSGPRSVTLEKNYQKLAGAQDTSVNNGATVNTVTLQGGATRFDGDGILLANIP